MAEPSPPYTTEEMMSDTISKKDLVTFLQDKSSLQFQADHKLKGQVKSVVKNKTKDQLIADYDALFATKSFKREGEDEEAAAAAKVAAELAQKTEKLQVKDTGDAPEAVQEEKILYTKRIMKKGNKVNFPRKGDTVSCFYTGKLEDGNVFDSNVAAARRGKKPQPLRFKIGQGSVIRGWDEVMVTMSAGEKAEVVIEPEWAYGKKGLEGKIPPNARLTFEVELVGID